MARTPREADPVLERLDAILRLSQDMAIFEAARAGLTRDSIRKIVQVGNNRISAIMSCVPRSRQGAKE